MREREREREIEREREREFHLEIENKPIVPLMPRNLHYYKPINNLRWFP